MTTTETTSPAPFPHHRVITRAEADRCEAEYKRRWQEWLDNNRDNLSYQVCAHDVHRAIWQGAYGAETITVEG